MPRNHRTASPTTGSSSSSSSASAPEAAAPEESSGFRGLLDRAGQAVGSQWDSAKRTVGGWVDSAGQAVDDLSAEASKWRRTAGEASDLDYDLGWGTVAARGSLSDVLEIGISAGVVPPDLRKILEGATASNIVSLHYDYSAGELVVEAQDLQVRGVSVQGMQIGTANLSGVRIAVRSDKIELLGAERRGSQAELTAAQCEALDVRYQGADGPMQAARMQLTGLSLRASSRQGQVLEGDVTGSVQIDGAAVEGFSGAGVTMESGQLSGVSAEVAEGVDGGSLTVGQVRANGVTQGGARLGNASAEGVRVDVSGASGVLQGQAPDPDALAAQVRVRTANVNEFSHPMASLSSGALDEILVRHDASGTTGTVGGVRAGGLDTSWADADQVEAGDLSVRMDEQGLHAGAGTLAARGVRTDQGHAARVNATGLGFDQTGAGSQARLDELRVGGIDTAAVDARGLAVRDVQAGWTADGGTARVGAVRADGVTSAQGGATSVSVGASEGRWRGAGDTRTARAHLGAIEARGVDTAHVDARTVSSTPVSVDVAGGVASFGADRLAATGLTGDNVGADTLSVTGATARLGADVRAGAQRIDAESLSAYGATVGRAQLTGAQVTSGEAGTQVNLAGLDVTDAKYQDLAAAGRLTANDARLDVRSGDDLDASLGAFRIEDLSANNFRAGDVRGSGIGVDVGGGRTAASVDRASLTGATIADRVDVGAGQVAGVRAAIDGADVRDVSLQSASVTQVHDRATGSSAAGANLAGVRYTNRTDRMSASVDQLGVTGARFDTGGAGSGGPAADGAGPQLDTDALIRSATRRVDDADVAFDVGVNPMQSTFADIAAGTRAQGRVTARDNQITDARVGLTRPVDGPLWIEGRGAYTDDEGRLRADLDGWYDHRVGGFVNDALGVQGDRLPTVSAIGDALTRPSAGGDAQGQGGSSPVDLASSRVSGSVGLSAGRIDAGAGQVDLASGRPGDNVVQFDAQGGRDVALAFSRILAGGLSADAGSHQVRTGQASLTGGSLNAAIGEQGTRVQGQLDAVDVAGLRVDGPGTARPTATTEPVRPQPRPTTAATTGPGASTYTVRSGDTLSAIAKQVGVPLAALAAANGVTDPSRIRVGQVLRLP